MSHSLYNALFKGAEPDAVCLHLPGRQKRTYGEMDVRAAQLAEAIRASGCEPGDRLIAQVDKSSDAFALYLACLRSGVTYVPLNTAYTTDEVRYFIEDAQPSLVVCRPDDLEALRDATDQLIARKLLWTLGCNGDGSLAAAADESREVNDPTPVAGDAIACMLYTSGTTGRSKGAMLSHRCLISNGRALHRTWGFGAGDVLLHALPIFHVHGLFVALNVAMLGGHETIYLDRFSRDHVIACLPEASVFMGVPTYYARLLSSESFDAAACRSVRLFTSGSAPMTEQLHQAFTERTGHRICERYGMTECGIITSNPYDGARVPGTVGYPLRGYQVRQRDNVIQVKGEHLFSGYWKRSAQTRDAFTDDGWFITGDVGSIADDGRLTLRGRANDMIISGGYNIYPKEIELALNDLSGAAESAVIGVPHPDLGEGVVAVIVLKPGVSEADFIERAKRQCQAKMARFKHPKRWVFVDELPRNAMGKVQKNVLRDRCARLLNDGEELGEPVTDEPQS